MTGLSVGPPVSGEQDENPDSLTPVCVLNHCYSSLPFV